MTTIDIQPTLDLTPVRPRPTGFIQDTITIAGRALRAVPKDLSAVIPPVLIAFFFFIRKTLIRSNPASVNHALVSSALYVSP